MHRWPFEPPARRVLLHPLLEFEVAQRQREKGHGEGLEGQLSSEVVRSWVEGRMKEPRTMMVGAEVVAESVRPRMREQAKIVDLDRLLPYELFPGRNTRAHGVDPPRYIGGLYD